ncbi:endospore germination permease [Alkalihalobacillus sp. 1P02AB]|uniref:endospore germination permease n=1 Tax=Alkalihalobacillus sp. 1P02AB TaxID=3132260 RepID=UPI0039A72EDA
MTFSRTQFIFLFLLFIGISNHVLIIPQLLGEARRDAWFCVLVGYGILLIWIGIYSIILKKNKQRLPLRTWLQTRTGKGFANFIMFCFMVYIMVISFISFFDLIAYINIYFLPNTALAFIILPFLLLCFWSAMNLRTIIYISALILPLVAMLGYFVAFFTIDDKDYSYLFPLFVDEQSSFVGGVIVVLGGSVDLLILFLLQQYFDKPISYLYLFLLLTLLVGLILGPTMGSLSAFGPNIAADFRFPAFEQWRLVMIGEQISHVDSMAVFQLLCGVIVRISLCLFLLSDLWKIQSAKVKKGFLITMTLFLGIAMYAPISDVEMQTILKNLFYPYAFIFGVCMTFLLLSISYLPERKRSQKL